MVLATSDSATYVFDQGTFALRQTIPHGGHISVANGVLYIADSGGTLRAYIAGPERRLVVQSDAGNIGDPTPMLYGTNLLLRGLAVTTGLASAVALSNGVRSVVTAWAGTGSVPAGGRGNSVSFVITNDSSLTWRED